MLQPPNPKLIIKDDNPLLREISEPVTEFDDGLSGLIQDMLVTMISNKGIGLSAIQIGVKQRVILAYHEKTIYCMINPEFIRKLNRETVEREGCLSIPGVGRQVSRPAKCELKWQDPDGNHHQGNFSGMLARILQHEIDHLDGILITDKPYL